MINGAHAILYGADAEGTRAAVGQSAWDPVVDAGVAGSCSPSRRPARRLSTGRRRPGGLYLLRDVARHRAPQAVG